MIRFGCAESDSVAGQRCQETCLLDGWFRLSYPGVVTGTILSVLLPEKQLDGERSSRAPGRRRSTPAACAGAAPRHSCSPSVGSAAKTIMTGAPTLTPTSGPGWAELMAPGQTSTAAAAATNETGAQNAVTRAGSVRRARDGAKTGGWAVPAGHCAEARRGAARPRRSGNPRSRADAGPEGRLERESMPSSRSEIAWRERSNVRMSHPVRRHSGRRIS